MTIETPDDLSCKSTYPAKIDRSTINDSATSTGDVTGRDKIVEGDEVHGDKMDGDKIIFGDGAIVHVYEAQPYRSPLQRPARTQRFQGRKDELAKLLDELHPGNVVTLCGPGGIGKSALAAEALWTLAPDDNPPERFPDGIFFHSFYNQPQAAVALEQIALSFGEDPHMSAQSAAQRALSGRNALLFLDGTEEADDLPSVLAVRNRCGVLITSRKRADALASRQDLSPLSPDDAVILLGEWANAGDTVTMGDAATNERLVGLVGRLPLAVCLAGRYLAESGMRATDYCEWLEASPLTALDQGQHSERSVPLLLQHSLNQVSEHAQAALAVLGLLALAPFPEGAVATVLGLKDRWQSLNVLGELVAYGLLTKHGQNFELSHALIHTYASKRLSQINEVGVPLVAWLVKTIEQSKSDLALLAQLRPHVLTLQQHCTEASLWQEVMDLANAIVDHLDLQGLWVERINVIQAALNAARLASARQDEGVWLGNLGNAYAHLSRVEEAIDCYEQALAIAREVDDRKSEGARLGNLGLQYYSLGKVEKAIDYYQQSLIIFREIGDREGEGARLSNLGLIYSDFGQLEKAIGYHKQALAIAREIPDRKSEGARLGNLAGVYYSLNRLEEAIEYLQQALAIAREIPDRRNEGNWLGNLGLIYIALGRAEEAIDYHRQALAISQEIRDRRGEGADLGNLGHAYAALRRTEEAIDYYQQALAISQEIDDHRNTGEWLRSLGDVYRSLNRVKEAIEYYQQSLTIFEEIESPSAVTIRELLAGLVE